MNLYEILSRKVYLSSSQNDRRNKHKSAVVSAAEDNEDDDEDDDDQDEYNDENHNNKRNKRHNNHKTTNSGEKLWRKLLNDSEAIESKQKSLTKKIFSPPTTQRNNHDWRSSTLPLSSTCDDPNHLHFGDNCCDILDVPKSYRRYRLLSAANASQARTESRAYFERIVSQVDRIKLAMICFACFQFAFSLALDFVAIHRFRSTENLHSNHDRNHHYHRLLKSITFAIAFPAAAAGIEFAYRRQPARHHFALNRRNSLFIITCTTLAVCGAEFASLLCHLARLIEPFPVLIGAKSALIAFLYVYLLYALFDLKLDAIDRVDAQKCIRCFAAMCTLGIGGGFAVHVFTDYPPNGEMDEDLRHKIRQTLTAILFGRSIITINCAIVFFLIWNGVGRLRESMISAEHFDDFLAHYDIRRNHRLTLNCVALACQAKTRHRVAQLNEDNFSIRTVKGWRKSCFGFVGSAIFAFAFTAEMCHVGFTSIWPDRYYPRTISVNQRIGAQLTLFACILTARLFLLFKPRLFGRKTSIDENRDLLRRYAWHHNCHRFALVYIAHIVANLMRLYLYDRGVGFVFATNILFGISIGCTPELVCVFLSHYMTITASTIRSALLAALCHLSLIAFALYYYLLTFSTHDPNSTSATARAAAPLFYHNLFGAILSLIAKITISHCRCLRSQNGFDLQLEMQSFGGSAISSSSPSSRQVSSSTPLPSQSLNQSSHRTRLYRSQSSNSANTTSSIAGVGVAITAANGARSPSFETGSNRLSSNSLLLPHPNPHLNPNPNHPNHHHHHHHHYQPNPHHAINNHHYHPHHIIGMGLPRPRSHNHLTIPNLQHQHQQQHNPPNSPQHSQRSASSSSRSQLFIYPAAAISDSNVHRKSSSSVGVIATRLKYRLESVVSIWK